MTNKLAIKTETIRALDADAMGLVVGGFGEHGAPAPAGHAKLDDSLFRPYQPRQRAAPQAPVLRPRDRSYLINI
jgi:hypothetical protein